MIGGGGQTDFTHTLEMNLKAPLILDEGLIALAMALDPIANLSAELVVAGGGAMELVG